MDWPPKERWAVLGYGYQWSCVCCYIGQEVADIVEVLWISVPCYNYEVLSICNNMQSSLLASMWMPSSFIMCPRHSIFLAYCWHFFHFKYKWCSQSQLNMIPRCTLCSSTEFEKMNISSRYTCRNLSMRSLNIAIIIFGRLQMRCSIRKRCCISRDTLRITCLSKC
jgi:hypothetical protein